MKKILFPLSGLLMYSLALPAQQNFTNNQPGALLNGQNNVQFWSRAGNVGGPGATNNVFGLQFNSPIYTITDNQIRTRLNGTFAANINGVLNHNVSGFFGIGVNNYFQTNTPWTMLHLEGPNNTVFGGGGWRSWMQTGMLTKENSDNMYVGMKSEFNPFTGTNYSDAIINWGDDAFNTPGGPDDLRFLFTAAATGNGTCTNCPTTPTGLNGREVMRLNANGNVGIGPVFSKLPLAGTNQPQSLLHLNIESNFNAWLQITSQNGTGQTAMDGTRFGILDNGNALMYQQENRQLLFSTAHITPVNSAAGTNERMRMMALNAPTTLPGGGTGVYNPGANPFTDATRVSISYDPGNPVTRPMSLLHIGYNTGSVANPASTDGWRPWMDVGTFTAQGTDNMYVGMKKETSNIPLQPDRYDAVINWGDNQGPNGPFTTGPDNLRFIFTSTTSGGPNTPPANGPDGMEAMRMTPNANNPSSVFVGVGGDPNTVGQNYSTGTANPGQTFEINSTATVVGPLNSGLRFTDLTSASATTANPGTGVLSVGPQGDVIYVPGSTGFGNGCGNAANPLTQNWEVPLNNFDLFFSGQGGTTNNVGIGLTCAQTPQGKLHVERDYPGASFYNNSTGLAVRNNDISLPGANLGFAYGIRSVADNTNRSNIGGYFRGTNGQSNIGVQADMGGVVSNQTATGFFTVVSGSLGQNIGIATQVVGNSGNNNIGGSFTVTSAVPTNTGVVGNATGATNLNIGGRFAATGSGTSNIAVRAIANGAPVNNNYALVADGDVFINSSQNSSTGYVIASDVHYKTNIDTFASALTTISQLQPKTFYYDTTNADGLFFDGRQHYGFIAQDVQTVLPSLVANSTKPADYDSTGAIVTPAVTFKSMSYVDLIAILTKGMQEQQRLITDQQTQLTALQAQVNGCCASARISNPNVSQTTQTDVELRDDQSIVLDQNVPNPFAEQTTISYFLPDGVQKAQMLFYNMEGKLINVVDLQGHGKGQLNVFANDLSNGVYTYSLVADGQIMASKRMVKNK